ncbi:MAG: D-alanine--D-alanine ligase family protein [Gaiella sp.]
MSRLRVAIIAGGRSSEHDVSLRSAAAVRQALDPERYDVLAVEIDRQGRWQLPPAGTGRLGTGEADEAARLPVPVSGSPAVLGGVDVVVPILHGPFGEDGTVQGVCELADVAYVGPGVLASALCMDKDRFKAVMRDAGVPVTPNITLRLGDEVRNPFGYPVFVKPARLGSSVGISKVRSEGDLEAAVALARRHDEKVLVEQFVDGMEIEVGILGNLPLPVASLPGQVVSYNADWYDHSSKYDDGGSELVVPPPGLSAGQVARAQELAVQAFVASECEGMARADFFVRAGDGEVVMNELNTIPGFTATSFYTRLFEASGIAYAELLDRLITLALERHERRSGLRY